jgi:hypothetical protein
VANPHPDQSGLRPSKKGDPPRNPLGINNKRRAFTNALIKLIEEKGLEDPFVRAGLKHAMEGDFNFWKYIYERVEGKLPGDTGDDLEDPQSTDDSGNSVEP